MKTILLILFCAASCSGQVLDTLSAGSASTEPLAAEADTFRLDTNITDSLMADIDSFFANLDSFFANLDSTNVIIGIQGSEHGAYLSFKLELVIQISEKTYFRPNINVLFHMGSDYSAFQNSHLRVGAANFTYLILDNLCLSASSGSILPIPGQEDPDDGMLYFASLRIDRDNMFPNRKSKKENLTLNRFSVYVFYDYYFNAQRTYYPSIFKGGIYYRMH